MHTSEDIFWKSSPKRRRRTAPLLPCRAFSTVINCLSTSGLTVGRGSLTGRYTTGASKIRSLSLRLLRRGLQSRVPRMEAVFPEL